MWNPTFWAAEEIIDRKFGDREVVRYMSTNTFLTSYMERVESRFKFAKRRAALDGWVGTTGATMGLNRAGKKNMMSQ